MKSRVLIKDSDESSLETLTEKASFGACDTAQSVTRLMALNRRFNETRRKTSRDRRSPKRSRPEADERAFFLAACAVPARKFCDQLALLFRCNPRTAFRHQVMSDKNSRPFLKEIQQYA
jgi:hypothetical protein